MSYFNSEFEAINNKFNTIVNEKNNLIEENEHLKVEITKYKDNIEKISEEYSNYNKVSVVKNLHNQIYEKDNLIKLLQSKLLNSNRKSSKEVEEVE